MDEQAVRLSLLIGTVIIFVMISIFVKKKMRIFLAGLMVVCVVAFTVNELTLDQRISEAYTEYEQLVEEHLDRTYPGEEWEITYDRTELSELWGHELYVVFENEPDVTYAYTIDDGEVIQAYASTEEYYEDYKH